MTIHRQRVLSNSSMMCVPPCEYMAPPYECVESSSDTSDTEVEENHNTWNALLEVLTLPASSPATQQGLHDWEVIQGGIVVPLRAGHCLHVHGVVSSRATARRRNTACELLVTKRETGREAAGTWALSGGWTRTAWVHEICTVRQCCLQ